MSYSTYYKFYDKFVTKRAKIESLLYFYTLLILYYGQWSYLSESYYKERLWLKKILLII